MTLSGTIVYSGPRSPDGRSILMFTRFREDVDPYFPGAGDGPEGIGTGPDFIVGWDADPGEASDLYVTWVFNDWVDVSSGGFTWKGCEAQDWFTMRIYAPASVTTVADPPNTGNVNLVDVGGFNIIIPAAGNGTHNIEEAGKVPVTSLEDTGYWKWDYPDTGKGTVAPSESPGKAHFNLFDVDLDLVYWLRRFHLLGDGHHLLNPETKARSILPHWKWELQFHTEGGHAPVHLSWYLCSARKNTV